MSGVLLGPAATAGLNAAALGLTWCQIPAETYPIGAADVADNLPRSVQVDAFELANTPTTNAQLAAALEPLGAQNTVLIVEEGAENRRWNVVARGTREEVEDIPSDTLRGVIRETLPLTVSDIKESAKRVGDLLVGGVQGVFDPSLPAPLFPKVVLVTLEAHLPTLVKYPDQPAVFPYFKVAAMAALYNLMMPTERMWEVVDEAPSNFDLCGMLGNVREWTASGCGGDDLELRGGGWFYANGFRVECRPDDRPRSWNCYQLGFRFARWDPRR